MDTNHKVHVKKDQKKVNDGGHKPFGVDLDPQENLCHVTNPDGSWDTFYKGSKMDRMDYIDELEDRTMKNAEGKDFASKGIGLFGGLNFDKNGNIIN